MSWLRIDDKFGQHPKVLGLSDREFRVHVLALCYCAEYRTDGTVPASAWKTLGITPRIIAVFVANGLWDNNDGHYSIHDFRKYNPADPTAAERKSRERSRKSHGDVTETSRSESRSSRAGTRARTRPVPSPTPEEPNALGTSEVLLEAGSSTIAAIESMIGMPNRGDPIARLAAVLPDRDEHTESVLRSFRLPEAAYEWTRQEVLERGGGAGYAVQVLKRIEAEGTIASATPSNEAPPTRTNVATTLTPEQEIQQRIANGALWKAEDLEAEISAAELNGDTADQLRVMLPTSIPPELLHDTEPETK